MTPPKLLRQGTIALVSFELGLALVYFGQIFQQGEASALLDFNGLRSLPSLMQAAHLFAISGLCGLLLLLRQRMERPCSRFLPLALAILCCFGGWDELIKLHLTFDQINWKVFYLGLLLAIPVLSWRDLLWVWRTHRATVIWVITGLGIFLLGGFGAEFLKGAIASEVSAHSSARIVFLSEHLRITIEEFAELMGETLILYAFAEFTLRNLWGAKAKQKSSLSRSTSPN